MIDNFDELINKAKELAKENFLKFAKNIYGVEEDVFEHLWRVPIIGSHEPDSIISATLSSKNQEEIHSILEECIDSELGDKIAAFVPFEKLAYYFQDKERKEYLNKLNNNEIVEEYNAFIVYKEEMLKSEMRELIQIYSKKGISEQQLESILIKHVTYAFEHEICHLNVNLLKCNIESPDIDELINGTELSLDEVDNGATFEDIEEWTNRNEVLVDTLSQMVVDYKDGDKIEDCLYKIIKRRKGESQYDEFDDKIVLSMYILFAEEITDWAMFGAYDQVQNNVLEKKIREVYGEELYLDDREIFAKLEQYCSKLDENVLSEKQIEMLEMLGVKRIITKQDMKEVATSKDAMSYFDGMPVSIDAILESLSKNNKKEEEQQ